MRLILQILMLAFPLMIVGQETPEKAFDEIEKILESTIADTDESFDFNTYTEQLRDLLRRPLNLNKVSHQEIMNLRLLSSAEAGAIISHREKFGKFISIFELQTVEGLDVSTARLIAPFFRSDMNLSELQIRSLNQLFSEGKFDFFIRHSQTIQQQRGFSPLSTGSSASRYLGDPSRIYVRFRYSFSGKMSYGLTAEKDAGEEFFRGSQKQGFDFYSAHFFLRDVKFFKQIALGDYEVKIGQGLVMWSGFGFGKSTFVTNIKKSSETLKQYTSADENNFLRGGATTLAFNNFEITGFFSHDKKDASITTTVDTFENAETAFASSISETGLHRTTSEIKNKDALAQTVAGGYIKYQKRASHIGISAVHQRLDHSLQRKFFPYNQFEFSGDRLTNFGMDYSLQIRNFYFFGEVAMTEKPAFATLHGFMASLDPKVDIAFAYRHYQRDYSGFFVNAFGESRKPTNEKGIYAGISVKPIRIFRLDAYIDYYRFEWLRYLVNAPSSGVDFLTQLTWNPSKTVEVYYRYKNEIKGGNLPDDPRKIARIIDIQKQNLRFNARYKISRSITFEDRVEYIIYKSSSKENGYLIYHDIDFRPLNFPISFSTRLMLFDTDSYNSRIYAFERDVLYYFSIPPMFDQGMKFYAALRYRVARWLDLWLKISHTYYTNRTSVGSALDEIEGNQKTEVRTQIRFAF